MSKKKFKQNTGRENNYGIQYSDFQSKKRKYSPPKRPQIQIKKIEYPEFICTKCGKHIEDLSAAIADKESGQPVHFDCVMEFLKKAEDLKQNEEVIYIGNGNFAVAYFENPKLRKNFKIIKLIEWEDKNKIYSWKAELADLASKV
ncbi:hypothetical protein [Treponema pedis]|uniref:hypothetical protein n=1 Tax=Treponema pedis TaxID=409322 RepID=UPI00040DF2CE|nr:hypothetical protein [Treponema pedis]